MADLDKVTRLGLSPTVAHPDKLTQIRPISHCGTMSDPDKLTYIRPIAHCGTVADPVKLT